VSSPVWIGVDIGGTKVLAGVVGPEGTVLRTARLASPGRQATVAEVEDALSDAVAAVAAGAPVAGVGIAAAGFVDADGERVRFAPHLPWRDDPVRSRLTERWGTSVLLENDATCAAVAESELGAAHGAGSAVLVTLGTGIGGGIAVGGTVLRGAGGMAGEVGHMKVQPGGAVCECGGRGCWEQYASGPALLRGVRASWERRGPVLQERTGGDPDQLTGPVVTEAADRGDPLAQEVLEEVGRWLGLGLSNLVAALDPECVVVGGGLAAAGEAVLAPARRELGAQLVGRGHRTAPPVVTALLGPEAGLVGAALLARAAASGA